MTVDSSKLDIIISKFLILYAVFYFVFTDVEKKSNLLDSLNTPTHAGNIYTDTYTKILKQSLSKDSNSKTCAVRWELEIKVKNQCHLFGTISSENSSLQKTTYLNLIYS